MPHTERNFAEDFEENIEALKLTTKVTVNMNS